MPTFRIPIDINWSGASGSPGVNVFHGRSTTDPVDPDLEQLTDALQAFYDAIDSVFPGTCTVSYAGEAYGVGDDTGETYTSSPWSVNGFGGADFVPPANQLLASWKTGSGGRNGRGRTFIGPLDASVDQGNGTPGESSRDAVQAAADALIATSSGLANGALGVYSRTENVLRDFQSCTVPNFFAVLRSRRD